MLLAQTTHLGYAARRIGLISLCLAVGLFTIDARADATRAAIERMAKTTSAWSPSFSPDGASLAFVSNLTGLPQVWIMPSGGGFPHRVTDLSDTVGSVQWSPAGDWLLVAAAPGGGENNQFYLVSTDGVHVKRITAGGRETNFGALWMPSGRDIVFSSNVNAPGAMTPQLYDLAEGTTRAIGQDSTFNRITSVRADGRAILVTRLAGRGNTNAIEIDLESGNETLLTPHEGPGSFFAEYAADGQSIYLGHNKDRDLIAFGKSVGQGGAIETLAEEADRELQSFETIPNTSLVALVWNEAGRNQLELFDIKTGQRTQVSIPAELIGSATATRDGQYIALTARGATDSTNLYRVSTETGEVHKLTRSSQPGVDIEALVRPELVEFSAHDGLELTGWLYRPRGDESPAGYVVSFHGGPEGQERPAFRSVYQALLAQGIGVFAPNIRGSSGFGKRFVNLDNRELRFDANKDIASAARYLIDAGFADPDRIGIMGGSYGGYAVMVGVTDYPDLFAAGVNLFGVVNFETFFANTEPWMAAISGTEYGDPVTQVELLRALSPIHKIDRVTTPLLVLHGANDTNVPVVEAEQVVENLEQRGVPVKYVLFEDEGHGFRKEKNRVTSDVETVAWFTTYLNAKEER